MSHSIAALRGMLRTLTLVALMLACTGLPSLVSAAVADRGDRCCDCGSDCSGNCDRKSCPPGPLCSGAPRVAVPDVPRLPTVDQDVSARPTFVLDTRVPASVDGATVFHPPRPAA